MEYEGVCYETPGWGSDLVASLIVKTDEGWRVAASHISSNAAWAERDVEYHYKKREQPLDGDKLTWVGKLTMDEIEARYGWATKTEEPT